MADRIITPPAVEPITRAEAKLHLRVDHTDDDIEIDLLIESARVFIEEYTDRALITQTRELVVDSFPVNEIMIPRPPLQSIESIKYDNGSGIEQTLDPSGYDVDSASEPGWVVPAIGGWPATFDGINAVRIRYIAGYDPSSSSPPDLAANVPSSIKNAMLLYLSMMFENRESMIVGVSATMVPEEAASIMHLLRQFRVALGMA